MDEFFGQLHQLQDTFVDLGLPQETLVMDEIQVNLKNFTELLKLLDLLDLFDKFVRVNLNDVNLEVLPEVIEYEIHLVPGSEDILKIFAQRFFLHLFGQKYPSSRKVYDYVSGN